MCIFVSCTLLLPVTLAVDMALWYWQIVSSFFRDQNHMVSGYHTDTAKEDK